MYGTTAFGGANGKGTVFEVTAGTHTLITLASFDGTNGLGPQGQLAFDTAGNLYGTATQEDPRTMARSSSVPRAIMDCSRQRRSPAR